MKSILSIPEIIDYSFNLKLGDIIPKIVTGHDRYGYFILQADNREKLMNLKESIFNKIKINDGSYTKEQKLNKDSQYNASNIYLSVGLRYYLNK